MSISEHPRISKARKAAKISSRTSGRSHQQELDNVARGEGFRHWGDMLSSAPAPATRSAPGYKQIAVGELKQWEFFGVEIGGYRIAASISADGPYIHGCRLGERSVYDDGVALGECTYLLELTSEESLNGTGGRQFGPPDPGLWVCKYGRGEPRLSLTRLDQAQGAMVATLFGIQEEEKPLNYGWRFYETPCWPALDRKSVV